MHARATSSGQSSHNCFFCIIFIALTPIKPKKKTPEMKALRLVDLEDLSQEEAGERMGVSHGTVWRLLQNARKNVITAIVQSRVLDILQPVDA